MTAEIFAVTFYIFIAVVILSQAWIVNALNKLTRPTAITRRKRIMATTKGSWTICKGDDAAKVDGVYRVRPIGEVFEDEDGTWLQVVGQTGCSGCHYKGPASCGNGFERLRGVCTKYSRKSATGCIYVEVEPPKLGPTAETFAVNLCQRCKQQDHCLRYAIVTDGISKISCSNFKPCDSEPLDFRPHDAATVIDQTKSGDTVSTIDPETVEVTLTVPKPPDGFEVVTSGETRMGDLGFDLFEQKWREARSGDKICNGHFAARKIAPTGIDWLRTLTPGTTFRYGDDVEPFLWTGSIVVHTHTPHIKHTAMTAWFSAAKCQIIGDPGKEST